MRWRFWLIDIPARVVDVWFRAYYVLLALLTIATVTGVILVLVLAALGLRW